jgi:hypothetical protein
LVSEDEHQSNRVVPEGFNKAYNPSFGAFDKNSHNTKEEKS